MIGLIISVVTCILIILSILFYPNIRIGKHNLPTYLVVAILGAIILIITHNVSISSILDAFSFSNGINPWKILVLFISMTILSIFLDELGFFKYIANLSIKHFNKSQMKLFFGFYIFLSILTIFTSNDIIVLTFTPFICYYAKRAHINPIPYLISEFVASNTWSMVLIIGNPTNIYLASSFNINFFEYVKVMFLPTLGASLISLGILFLIFRKKLKEPMSIDEEEYEEPNKFLTISGLVILFACIIMIAISNYIQIETWLVTLSCALLLNVVYLTYKAISKDEHKYMLGTLKRAPWGLIPFVLSMFVVVLSLKEQGITQILANFFDNDIFAYGFSGALCANLINNIPMSVLYSEILTGTAVKDVYSAIIASNIAAYISPFGALAGIMWLGLLKDFKVKFSFSKFVEYGVIIGIPTLALAVTILYLE